MIREKNTQLFVVIGDVALLYLSDIHHILTFPFVAHPLYPIAVPVVVVLIAYYLEWMVLNFIDHYFRYVAVIVILIFLQNPHTKRPRQGLFPDYAAGSVVRGLEMRPEGSLAFVDRVALILGFPSLTVVLMIDVPVAALPADGIGSDTIVLLVILITLCSLYFSAFTRVNIPFVSLTVAFEDHIPPAVIFKSLHPLRHPEVLLMCDYIALFVVAIRINTCEVFCLLWVLRLFFSSLFIITEIIAFHPDRSAIFV